MHEEESNFVNIQNLIYVLYCVSVSHNSNISNSDFTEDSFPDIQYKMLRCHSNINHLLETGHKKRERMQIFFKYLQSQARQCQGISKSWLWYEILLLKQSNFPTMGLWKNPRPKRPKKSILTPSLHPGETRNAVHLIKIFKRWGRRLGRL